MNTIVKIKTFLNYISNCTFFCKDGYHHLPYLGDSPQMMLEGFKNLPFVVSDEKNKLLLADNLWIDVKLKYLELEQGLWIIIHDAYFKANICAKAIYEQTDCDYYSLFYYVNKNKMESKNARFKNVEVESKNCTLHSPNSEITGYMAKGTQALVVNFMFDKNWVERNIDYASFPHDNALKAFFNNQSKNLICNDFTKNTDHLIEGILKILKDSDKKIFQFHLLKNKASELLFSIISHIGSSDKKNLQVDYKIINVIEIELAKTLKSHFPGLEKFAKACNCSISKLKYIAEEYYGKGGLSAVHQKKRMELARQMIEENSNKYINEIAYELGYENPCKFSEAFKKQFGFTPAMTSLKLQV